MDALERIADDPVTAPLYRELMDHVCSLGELEVRGGKTAVHVQRQGSRAFLGIHPRQGGLRLNVVTDARIVSARIQRSDQVSARRWHNELVVHTGGELDAELLDWIEDAWALAEPA